MAKRYGGGVGSGTKGRSGQNGDSVWASRARRAKLGQSGASARPRLGGVALGPGQALQPDAALLAPAGAPRQWAVSRRL